ncbi:MAG: DMT family transporter [Pseudomonadota bacterium]
MALFLLIALVMVNFAANSLLNRAGIDVFGMDALGFAGVRLAAGAVMLAGLVAWRRKAARITAARWVGALWLLVYLVPFSLAYVTLPSGVGALVLFGVVQVTMFAGAALAGVRPGIRAYAGMGVAMAGLAWLLWPRADVAFDPLGLTYMAVAGIGWGLFSLRGRGSADPLGDMAWSFVLLMPVALVLMVLGTGWSAAGVAIGVVCGAVTSGLGYALWYRALPQITATTAAVAQLSVPVIALLAGAALLGEALGLQVLLGAGVVLGGIALAVIKR